MAFGCWPMVVASTDSIAWHVAGDGIVQGSAGAPDDDDDEPNSKTLLCGAYVMLGKVGDGRPGFL